jgi:hypothetical protein
LSRDLFFFNISKTELLLVELPFGFFGLLLSMGELKLLENSSGFGYGSTGTRGFSP